MAKIVKKLTDLVGNTPLMELSAGVLQFQCRQGHTGETDRKAGICQSGRKCEGPGGSFDD